MSNRTQQNEIPTVATTTAASTYAATAPASGRTGTGTPAPVAMPLGTVMSAMALLGRLYMIEMEQDDDHVAQESAPRPRESRRPSRGRRDPGGRGGHASRWFSPDRRKDLFTGNTIEGNHLEETSFSPHRTRAVGKFQR